MHHYGEDSTTVQRTKEGYRIVFRNKQTGQEITMDVPEKGSFDDRQRAIRQDEVEKVGREIAHILRQILV